MAGNRNGKPDPVEVRKEYATDKDRVRDLFFESQYVEWAPFAASLGWNAQSTRIKYPVATWVAEKKRELAINQAETIADKVFGHRHKWHDEVLKTLRDYPETADAIHTIVRRRVNETIEMMAEDERNKNNPKYKPKFSKMKNSDIYWLAKTFATAQETKYRSMLLHDWNVKLAEQYTRPEEIEKAPEENTDTGWTIEIKGGQNISSDDLQKHLMAYYDPPQIAVVQDGSPSAPVSDPQMDELPEDLRKLAQEAEHDAKG